MEETYVFIVATAGQNGNRYFAKKMQRELDKAACFIHLQPSREFNVLLRMPGTMNSSASVRLKFAAEAYLLKAIARTGKKVAFRSFLPKELVFPETLKDLYVSCSFWDSLFLKRTLSRKGNFSIHRIRIKFKPVKLMKKLFTGKPAYC